MFFNHNAGLILDFGSLRLTAGRFAHRDFLDTPYSLFVSGHEPYFGQTVLPALLADVTFDGGRFTYESRWVSLNARSDLGYPDRGANYKVYALQLGDFRFGLQDSAVYYDRSFDLEYFLSQVSGRAPRVPFGTPGLLPRRGHPRIVQQEGQVVLAVQVADVPRLNFGASLEYVLSGSKSPANPWHEAEDAPAAGRYTQMFGEGLLEHTLTARARAAWTWRAWTLYGRLSLGGVFNRLALEPALDAPADPAMSIYRPQAGDHRLLYGLTVGATYSLGIGRGAGRGGD